MNFSIQAYLNELRPLIDVDCGTLNKAGIEKIAALLSEKYQELGWHINRVELGDAGCGLEIRNKPDTDTIDLLMIGHMDTVFPDGTVAKRPMTYDDKRAYGPGVSDMKSGLINIIYAIRELDKGTLNRLSICVCMNPDEETGSTYSEEWLTQIAKKATTVLVAEAARADGSLVKARKGMAKYEISFSGKAAHAGNEPEKGRSAISEMANWIVAIDKMTDFESGTIFNTGVVSGGTGANIIAPDAKAELDVRFWDNDEYALADRKLKLMIKSPYTDGVGIRLERKAYKPAMVPGRNTESLMKLVELAGEEEQINIHWQAVGGGSDANFTAALGIPTLDGLGPIGGGFHTDDEFLELESVEPRIRLLKSVITKLVS